MCGGVTNGSGHDNGDVPGMWRGGGATTVAKAWVGWPNRGHGRVTLQSGYPTVTWLHITGRALSSRLEAQNASKCCRVVDGKVTSVFRGVRHLTQHDRLDSVGSKPCLL